MIMVNPSIHHWQQIETPTLMKDKVYKLIELTGTSTSTDKAIKNLSGKSDFGAMTTGGVRTGKRAPHHGCSRGASRNRGAHVLGG